MDDTLFPAAPITNADHLAARVKEGETPEGIHLDFKERLADKEAVHEDTARDIAAFANSWGGTILVGISESARSDGVKVAGKFVGISDFDLNREALEQRVRTKWLAPNTLPFDVVPIPLPSNRVIMAINVPPLIGGLAAVWQHPTIVYPARNSHGKRYLSPLEVEMRLAESHRTQFLRLHELVHRLVARGGRARHQIPVEIISFAAPNGRDLADLRLGELNESEFTLKLGRVEFAVPYDLLESSWEASNNRLGLCLSVQVHFHGPPDDRASLRRL